MKERAQQNGGFVTFTSNLVYSVVWNQSAVLFVVIGDYILSLYLSLYLSKLHS